MGPGQLARFRLAIDTTAGSALRVAQIDVRDATTGESLASRDLYRGEFEGGLGAFSEFALAFDTTGCGGHALEYRVYWDDRAQLAHDLTLVSWTSGAATTGYTYDVAGHLTGVTDAAANVTTMTYDALGRKTGMLDPDMGAWGYQYDLAGNLTGQTDARGCTTTFSYDPINRLTGKTYSGSCSGSAVSYTYDQAGYGFSQGRRTRMTDGSGQTTTWTYDARGRVTLETQTISGVGYPTAYTYNARDQVVTTTYPDGEGVTASYTAAGQPATLSGTSAYVNSASYGAGGRLVRQTLGNGVTTAYAYNPQSGRLVAAQTGTLLDLAYAYDRAGNVTRLEDAQEVGFSDSFDSQNSSAWVWNGYQSVPYVDGENRVARNSGTGTSYDAHFYRNGYTLDSGDGLRVRFKVDRGDTAAHFMVEADGSPYRRIGLLANSGKLYVQYTEGAGWIYPQDLLQPVKVGVWYVLRLTLDDAAGFTVEVYEEADPGTAASYTRSMPAGLNWRFHHWTYRGVVELDAYTEWASTQRGSFSYDTLDRLTAAAVTGGGGGLYSRTYAYNPIGNLTAKTDLGTYTYGPSGHTGCTTGTPSAKPHAVTAVSGRTFAYDCNGNMRQRVIGGRPTI